MDTGFPLQFRADVLGGSFDLSLDEAKRAAENGSVEEAAKSFERLFATMLVREMRRSLPDGFFGSVPGADTFEGWLDEHLGAALAEGNALGLAESLRADLIRKNAAP